MFPDTLSDRSPSNEEEPLTSLVQTLGSSGEGIVLLDEDLEVTWANRAAAGVFGVAVEAMIGRPRSPMTDPAFRHTFEQPDRFLDPVREAFRDHRAVGPLECRVRPGEGRVERRLLYRSDPISDGPYRGGQIERYTDVTDLEGIVPERNSREEADVELKKFKAFFDAAPDPAWMLDADGVVEEVNRVLMQGLGFDRDEIVGCPVDELPFLSEDEQEAAADIFARRMQGERFPPFPFEYRKQDGSKGYVEISARVLKDEENFIGEIGVARDITEQKRAEDQLRESEERFRQLATNIREVFWLTDLPEGDLSREKNVYISPVYEKIWGRPVDDLSDDAGAWLEAVVPEDRERVIEARKRIKEGEYNVEYRITRPDGEIRWIHDRGFPVADEDGNVERIAGLSVDITDRKRRQLELEASREKFHELFEAAPDLVWLIDADGTFREINQACVDTLGYDRDEIIGRSIEEIPFLSGKALQTALEKQIMGLQGETIPSFVIPFESKHGQTIQAEVNIRVLKEQGDPVGAISVARDITERKRAEDQLRESEERFRQLAANIQEVFWLTNLPEKDPSDEWLIYVSPVFEDVWGRPVEDLHENPGLWLEAIVAEDRERVMNTYGRAAQGKFEVEYRIERPDGEIRWIHDRGFPVADEDGNPERIAGLSTDVTDRKRRQLELQASREKFRTLFDAAPDPAYLTDGEGVFQEINRAFVETLGYDREEIIGCPIDELPFLSGEARRTALQKHAMGLRGESIPSFVLPIQKKDGQTLQAELNVRLLREEGGITGAIGVARDITERKRREDELKAARRELKAANQELKKQSREDALTELPNKRRFNEMLDQEWARHRRQESTLSMIMADLDNFKRYNDTHGHKAGDDVLRSVGEILRTVLNRPADLPARWGGEEFAVILPETDREGAMDVADTIRRAVEDLDGPDGDSPNVRRVTVSAGVATVHPGETNSTSNELVQQADSALYESKDRGKNCVTVYEPDARSSVT